MVILYNQVQLKQNLCFRIHRGTNSHASLYKQISNLFIATIEEDLPATSPSMLLEQDKLLVLSSMKACLKIYVY